MRFFPVVNWAERGNFGDGNSVPRFHLTWGTGKALVQAVWGAIESHPRRSALDLRLRSRVTGLDLRGRASGRLPRGRRTHIRRAHGGAPNGGHNTSSDEPVRATEDQLDDHDGYEVRAGKAVVIAAGGIGGNLELVRREWPTSRLGPAPEEAADGLALLRRRRAARRGAPARRATSPTSRACGTTPTRCATPNPSAKHHGLKLIPPRSGVMLNPDGRRYGPVPVMPTFDAYSALERMCEDERKYSWLICNFKIAKRELDVSGSQHNPHLREKRLLPFLLSVLLGKPGLVKHFLDGSPDFVSASTLGELAVKMNEVTGDSAIDAAVLEREIGRYDETIARGKGLFNDDQLRRIGQLRNWRGDRLRTSRFQRIVDPKAMPLIAIRLQPMARKSLGGIQTDLGCRVLAWASRRAHPTGSRASRATSRSPACTRSARPPASAVAACTASARWRARFSADASSPGAWRPRRSPGPSCPCASPRASTERARAGTPDAHGQLARQTATTTSPSATSRAT